MKRTFLAVVAALFFTGHAAAEFMAAVTIEGTLSGSLGGVPFTNAHVVFVGVYDTGDVRGSFGSTSFWSAPLLQSSVDVSSVGTAEIQVFGLVRSYTNPPSFPLQSAIGMSFIPGFLVEGGYVGFSNYDLSHSFGPVDISFDRTDPLGWPDFSLPTSVGPLIVSEQSLTDWTARVDVTPEPATWQLLVLAVIGLVITRRYRKRSTAAIRPRLGQ